MSKVYQKHIIGSRAVTSRPNTHQLIDESNTGTTRVQIKLLVMRCEVFFNYKCFFYS